MKRVLEPEVMDDPEGVAAYAAADFSDSNQRYVDHLVQAFSSQLRRVVDLGCGPAAVPVQLARAVPAAEITAVDASAAMLEHARQGVKAAGFGERITLHRGRVPGLALSAGVFDAVLSKDFLHHLPDPMVLWREAIRLGKPGAVIYVMDLIRPPTPEHAWEIVERVAPDEPPVLKDDFFHSLCAAFTLEEIREQLMALDLDLEVVPITERHVLVKGYL